MPSNIKVVAFRPNKAERIMLDRLADKIAMPDTRIVGMALRELATRYGVVVSASEAEKLIVGESSPVQTGANNEQ